MEYNNLKAAGTPGPGAAACRRLQRRDKRMTTASVFWLAALIALLVVEGATVSMVSIWFAIGAAAALLVSLFSSNLLLEALVFAVVSAGSLLACRPLVAKLQQRRADPTNGDRNIGRTATVLEPITPDRPGRVRLDGVDWTARVHGSVSLQPGQLCRVFDIQSTVLIVEPQPETAAL